MHETVRCIDYGWIELKIFRIVILEMWDIHTLSCWPCGPKNYVQHRKDSHFFFFQSSLTKPLLIRKYANIFIVVIVVLLPLKHHHFPFPFLFFLFSIITNKKIFFFLIPFPFHYHRFCSKLTRRWRQWWREKGGDEKKGIKKTQICGQRFAKPNKLKRWKLVWMQWAESLIRDMTIILLLFESAKPNDRGKFWLRICVCKHCGKSIEEMKCKDENMYSSLMSKIIALFPFSSPFHCKILYEVVIYFVGSKYLKILESLLFIKCLYIRLSLW